MSKTTKAGDKGDHAGTVAVCYGPLTGAGHGGAGGAGRPNFENASGAGGPADGPANMAAVKRVIEFLATCENSDIRAGVGYIEGNGSEEQKSALRRGIMNAIRGSR